MVPHFCPLTAHFGEDACAVARFVKTPHRAAGQCLWDRPSVPLTNTHAQNRFWAEIAINKQENASKSFKMWHLYRTLTSDVTSDYSGNVANTFKVKLGLRLPGEGWKVSIITAIVPKMALFKDLQTITDPLIALSGKTFKNGASHKWVRGELKASDLKAWEKTTTSSTVHDFFNRVMQIIGERSHANLDRGYKFSYDFVHLEWDKSRVHPELMLKSADRQNVLSIEKTFSNVMGWTEIDGSGNIILGKNMAPIYKTFTKGKSTQSSGRAFGVANTKYITLNALSDWRFFNLEQSFKEALNLHARPLVVSTKVTSGTGATKVTYDQPMSHLYYAPQGRERYVFTPPVEEFHPVYTPLWTEVEITLQELDGSAVTFQPDSQCLLRLHFQQD